MLGFLALHLWEIGIYLWIDTLNKTREVYRWFVNLGRGWEIIKNSIIRYTIYRESWRWCILWSQDWCSNKRSQSKITSMWNHSIGFQFTWAIRTYLPLRRWQIPQTSHDSSRYFRFCREDDGHSHRVVWR